MNQSWSLKMLLRSHLVPSIVIAKKVSNKANKIAVCKPKITTIQDHKIKEQRNPTNRNQRKAIVSKSGNLTKKTGKE